MKKFLALLSCLICFSASAEWVLVTKNEMGTALYVDPNIKIKGDVRWFWHMQDLAKADTRGDLSYRGVWQYNCNEKVQRNMQIASYAQPLAGGPKTEEAYQPTDWVPIGNDPTSQAMMKYICSL